MVSCNQGKLLEGIANKIVVFVNGFLQFSHISVGLKAQDGKEVDEELFGSNG